jgi:hypothetical protein
VHPLVRDPLVASPTDRYVPVAAAAEHLQRELAPRSSYHPASDGAGSERNEPAPGEAGLDDRAGLGSSARRLPGAVDGADAAGRQLAAERRRSALERRNPLGVGAREEEGHDRGRSRNTEEAGSGDGVTPTPPWCGQRLPHCLD